MEVSESDNLLDHLLHLVDLSELSHQQQLSLLLLLLLPLYLALKSLHFGQQSTFLLHLLLQL